MSQNWQLQAVEEQNKIFNSLTQPHYIFNDNSFREFINKVNGVIREYHTLSGIQKSSTRKICGEIVKHSEENCIKFCFAVIVTSRQEQNNQLSKTPVFVVIRGNGQTYIDMQCTAYSAWAALLKNNNYPPCESCFPLNGIYNVGGKLEIDFATYGAAPISPKISLSPLVKFGLAAALVAASFFFRIPKKFLDCSRDVLLPFARQFLSSETYSFLGEIHSLTRHITTLKDNFELDKLLIQTARIFQFFYSNFKDEISAVFEIIIKTLTNTVRKFTSLFQRGSKSSQNDFLAITYSIDNDIVQADKEAGDRINEVIKCENYSNIEEPEHFAGDEINSEENAISEQKITQNESDARRMFENCKLESSLSHNISEKKNGELSEHTQDLLNLCISHAEQAESLSLEDIQTYFEGLTHFIINCYNKNTETYTEMLKAANKVCGKDFDVELFNRELGIIGDPRNHFWKKSLDLLPKSSFLFVCGLIEQTKKKQKLVLIPVSLIGESKLGLYRSVGVKGKGKFSAKELKNALNELINIREENCDQLFQNAIESYNTVYIKSTTFTVFAHQEINETNTSEGFVHISHTNP